MGWSERFLSEETSIIFFDNVHDEDGNDNDDLFIDYRYHHEEEAGNDDGVQIMMFVYGFLILIAIYRFSKTSRYCFHESEDAFELSPTRNTNQDENGDNNEIDTPEALEQRKSKLYQLVEPRSKELSEYDFQNTSDGASNRNEEDDDNKNENEKNDAPINDSEKHVTNNLENVKDDDKRIEATTSIATSDTHDKHDLELGGTEKCSSSTRILLHDDEGDSPDKAHRSISNACAICLECYKPGDRVVWSMDTKFCPHAFHEPCIVDYFAFRSKKKNAELLCPCCRQPFVTF